MNEAEAKTGHTAGKWRLSRDHRRGGFDNSIEGPTGAKDFEGDDGYRTVCTFQACMASSNFAEREANATANAHLIAAAPDLLAALTEVREWIKNWSPDFTQDEEWADTDARITAALSKATGGAA